MPGEREEREGGLEPIPEGCETRHHELTGGGDICHLSSAAKEGSSDVNQARQREVGGEREREREGNREREKAIGALRWLSTYQPTISVSF